MRYWSYARYDLQLSDDEFMSLTPRQFHALSKRHKEQVEHKELLIGILASVVVNSGLNAPEKPVQPKQFMPSQWEQKQKPQTRMTKKRRARVANMTRAFFQSFAQAQRLK